MDETVVQWLGEEYKSGRITRDEYENAVKEEMGRGYFESGDEYGMRVLPEMKRRGKKAKRGGTA